MSKMMRWESCHSVPHSIMGQVGVDSDLLSSVPWGSRGNEWASC